MSWKVVTVGVLLALAFSATAAAEPPSDSTEPTYDCGYLGEDGCRESDQAREPGPSSASCRIDVEAVFWTGTDWERLAKAMGNDRTPCGEYWVSIPPLAANKKGLRVLQDDVVRSYGVHPIAEFSVGEVTGWANWVLEPGRNRTWFQAGVEFRRAMAAAGYQGPDETWLLNELDRTTMRDGPRESPDHPWPAFRRGDMVQLLSGLYYGDIGMEPLPGVVEIGIHFRHQNLPAAAVARYHADAKAWIADNAFWSAISPTVRWLAVETYPDVRNWGVPGSSRGERRRALEEYVFHLLELVQNAPRQATAARDLFERAYLPLVNAGYRARGGEQFDFRTGHGNTITDATTMQHFVSEQVHAVRHYAGSHSRGAPGGRIGFSWQPCNRTSATQPDCDAFTLRGFAGELDLITARLAEAIHYAYKQGGASPVGACGPPGSAADWCEGTLPGAQFTDLWRDFGDWD
jgi:hypothetical protein